MHVYVRLTLRDVASGRDRNVVAEKQSLSVADKKLFNFEDLLKIEGSLNTSMVERLETTCWSK